MSEPGRDNFSDSTLKLSERYGLDPARLDAMMGNTRSGAATPEVPRATPPPATEPTREWIEERRIQQPHHDVTALRSKDAVKIVDPVLGPIPSAAQPKKVKEVRKEAPPAASTARSETTETYRKQGVSPLTWIIGLVILGLIAIMFFVMRGCDDKPVQQVQTPIVDTVIKTDTVAAKDTVAIPVEPAIVNSTPERSAANRARVRAKNAGSSASRTRNVALSTTSSFAAQEKLAELKADGNTKAKIQRVNRNGVTLYQVKTK